MKILPFPTAQTTIGLANTLLVMLLAVLTSPLIWAQPYDWRTEGKPIREHFDTVPLSGDPQNFAIAQDEKGAVYVANGKALLIYNGQDWQTLKQGEGKLILSFAFGGNNRIYAGPLGDVGYFEADKSGHWQFTSLIEGRQVPKFTTVIHVVAAGEHIIFSTDTVFFHYHPDTGLSWHDNVPGPIKPVAIDGQILFPSVTGQIYRYNLETRTLTEAADFPEAGRGKAIMKLRNGNLLLYDRHQLFLMEKQGEVKRFNTEIDSWLNRGEIVDIEETAEGNLVIAARFAGIAVITPAGKRLRLYTPDHGLESVQLYDILVDREGSLWMTFQDGGLSRVELNSNVSEYADGRNYLYNISSTKFKNQYFVSSADGLFRLEPAPSPEKQARFVPVPELGRVVYYFLNDQDSLLVSHDQGVSALDMDTSGAITVTPVYKTGGVFSQHVMKMIHSKYDPNIIYAIRAVGLLRFIKQDGAWRYDGSLEGFGQNVISIVEDKPGHLWLGTDDGKFFRVSGLENWPRAGFNVVPFPDPQVRGNASVFSIGPHVLFSNGYGGKIYGVTDNEKEFVASTLADWERYGITHIEQTAGTGDGKLWFSTRKDSPGSARIGLLEPGEDATYHIDFSPLDHLKPEVVLGLNTTDEGDLWINSRGRILRYRTGNPLPENSLSAPILNNVIELGSGKRLFTNDRFDTQSPTVELRPEHKAVSVHYSAVNYRHKRTLEYRHRKPGRESSWSAWSSQPYVELTNVPAFDSKLEVQYRTNAAKLSPIAAFNLYRAPYWYQQVWAKAFMVAFGLAFLVATAVVYAHFRNRRLRLRATELENRVAERTAIISEQNRQLKLMDEAKSRFFTNLSHEFRTPLTLAIGTLRDLLSKNTADTSHEAQYLDIALKNNLHMENLLTQVLDINRLENGVLPVKVVKTDIGGILQYCIQRFRAQTQKRNIAFVMRGLEKQLEIYFDPDHLEKILFNLLSNAIKYSPDNGHIYIDVTERENEVHLSVTDEGPGIAVEDQKYVFDRYYQGKSASYTLQPGTGIGLALVRELVNLHHGEISFSAPPEGGARFILSLRKGTDHYSDAQLDLEPRGSSNALPTKREEHAGHSRDNIDADNSNNDAGNSEIDEDNSKLAAGQGSPNLSVHGQKTLLIVDDNAELRQFIRTQLQNTYNILEAENGRAAYESTLSQQPDLIVSDVMMPVMDGLELTEKLKSALETAHIPVILLTAKSDRADTIKGLQHGADDYLGKPFDTAELAARIAAQLNQKQRLARALYAEFRRQLAAEPPAGVDDIDTRDGKSDLAEKILSAMDKNIDNPDCSLATLSEELHMHWATLTRRVKELFDCTPIQLLRRRRLQTSLRMLHNNKGNISEIAYACGFESLAYFSRCFKEEYSFPPSRYKEVKKPPSERLFINP